MGIYMLLFSDGGVFSNQCQHTFPPACPHIMQESGRSASNTTASLILYWRILPNDHNIQVLRADQLLFIGVELLRSSTYI